MEQEIIKHYKEAEDREQGYIVVIQRLLIANKMLTKEKEELKKVIKND